jgi:hypothetical protein
VLSFIVLIVLFGLACAYRRHKKASQIIQQLKSNVTETRNGMIDPPNVTRKRNGRIVVDGDAATEDNMSTPRSERDREVDELLTPRSKSILNAQSSQPQSSDLRASLLQRQNNDQRITRLTRSRSRCIRADLERATNSSDGSNNSHSNSGTGGAGVGVNLELNADEIRESRAAFLTQQEEIDEQLTTGQITSRPFSNCSDLMEDDDDGSQPNYDSDDSKAESVPKEQTHEVYLGDIQNDETTQNDDTNLLDPLTPSCSTQPSAPSAESISRTSSVGTACPAPSRLPRPSVAIPRNTFQTPSTIVEEDNEGNSHRSSPRSSNGSVNLSQQPLMVNTGGPRVAQHV